jgi:glycosyltransferase involved in cell wall biosynthesis
MRFWRNIGGSEMKVTFCGPFAMSLFKGGADLRAIKTAQKLKEKGVEVEFLSPYTTELGDIVHFWDIRDAYRIIVEHCLNNKKPYIVSPILRVPFLFSKEYIPAVLLKKFPFIRKMTTSGFIFGNASLLIATSRYEKRRLSKIYKIPEERIRVIPNPVDERFFSADGELFRKHFSLNEPFILNVGRIEPFKNQLRLIRAIRGKYKLVVIGRDGMNKRYVEKCKEEGKGWVLFTGYIPHESPLLPSAYASCHLFALPSIQEVAPQVNLEAAAAGARIVTSTVGASREYLGEWAEYCNPWFVGSIRKAIEKMWNKDIDREKLRDYIRENFSWDSYIEKHIKVYEEALERRD